MLVFITSPRRKTPYHFDSEVNFLVQLQGSKNRWVCDPMDRSKTTEEEIEGYYSVSIIAGTYKSHGEKVARQFTLYPGDAVHIPTHAAHCVQNHDNVSISLSLYMEFPQHYGDAYRAKHHLRKLGLSPTAGDFRGVGLARLAVICRNPMRSRRPRGNRSARTRVRWQKSEAKTSAAATSCAGVSVQSGWRLLTAQFT